MNSGDEEEEPEEVEAGREKGESYEHFLTRHWGSLSHTTCLHISSRDTLRVDLFAAG